MTLFLPVNDVSTTLASAASSTATVLTLSSMANLPASIPSGMVIPFTITTAVTAANREIVYATSINSSNITVLRAQENTSAQNWNPGDSIFVAVTAGLLQSFANLAGNASQTFNVAPATTGIQAVPLAQAFQVIGPTGSQTISLTALQTLVLPSLLATATITMAPGAILGQRCRVMGAAYAVTIASNVSSGGPSFIYPDETADYSWTIPAGQFGAFIDLIWDGGNWRVSTGGETVIADATGSNQALALGQANGLYMPIGETVVNTFNGRSGSVLLSSGDVTSALTYIPAALNGSNSEQFNVGNATSATEAVNLGQFSASYSVNPNTVITDRPDGKIEQWFITTVTTAGSGLNEFSITFPEAFPTEGYEAQVCFFNSAPVPGVCMWYTISASAIGIGVNSDAAESYNVAIHVIGH